MFSCNTTRLLNDPILILVRHHGTCIYRHKTNIDSLKCVYYSKGLSLFTVYSTPVCTCTTYIDNKSTCTEHSYSCRYTNDQKYHRTCKYAAMSYRNMFDSSRYRTWTKNGGQ